MNIRKWLDDFAIAAQGIFLVRREKRFWVGFAVSFVVFAWLMNLLSGGFSKFELMVASGLSGAMKILGDAFLNIFGVNKFFSEWLPIFIIASLQGVLIGLIAVLWQKKRAENAANVQRAGIITGLIALGAGCPTCGTTLITPLIGAFVSTGSLAVAGAISTIVTWVAVGIAILAIKRLGVETYVIIKNEEYLAKKAKQKEESGRGRNGKKDQNR